MPLGDTLGTFPQLLGGGLVLEEKSHPGFPSDQVLRLGSDDHCDDKPLGILFFYICGDLF